MEPWIPRPLSMRPGQSSCGLLALGICLHKAQAPEWYTGIPVLVRWAAIAVFRTAAIGFAFFCFVCVCTGVCVQVCVYRCVCTGVCVQVCVYRCVCTGVCCV